MQEIFENFVKKFFLESKNAESKGKTMIFESHAHYNDDAFDEDRDELLRSMPENGVLKLTNVCADLKSIDETIDLIKKYDYFYGVLGIHPSDSGELTEEDIQRIRKLCQEDLSKTEKERRILAIGEIGLDYHWPEPSIEIQKKWFYRQMELARELDMPVVIHSREACQDTLEILRQYPEVKGIVHCYSYSKETARDFLSMGYYFGIGGVVTFNNAKKLKEAVAYIPMDRIVLETDCPYMAPVPNRGKRNSSLNIPYVIEEIAKIKEMKPEEVEQMAWDNTFRVFRIEAQK